MATLQKFKFLATQCAVARSSPSRSPSASPVFQLRRRKTLRMLFSRKFTTTYTSSSTRTDLQRLINNRCDESQEKNHESSIVSTSGGRNKLKDLFISSPSPPPPHEGKKNVRDNNREEDLMKKIMVTTTTQSNGVSRSILSAFRYRLIKRSWRPVLVTIAE